MGIEGGHSLFNNFVGRSHEINGNVHPFVGATVGATAPLNDPSFTFSVDVGPGLGGHAATIDTGAFMFYSDSKWGDR